jgi:hypothetical protein
VIDAQAKRSFYEEGYFVARGLFDADEATFWRDYFTTLREARIPATSSESIQPRTIR